MSLLKSQEEGKGREEGAAHSQKRLGVRQGWRNYQNTKKLPRTQEHTGTVTEETGTAPQVEKGMVVAAEMWLSPTTWWRMAHVGGRGRKEGCREGEGWLAQGSKLRD